MVMEKWIFLCVVTLCSVNSFSQGFEFVYNEVVGDSQQDVARVNVTMDGSYATIGDWPHWCLGNLSRCDDGLVIDIWAKFTEIAEDSSGILVFSNGGHNWYSNGFYMLQRYGNEYEFGVSHFDATWSVGFRLFPGLWTNIRATWDSAYGLVVIVDGARFEAQDAASRDFQEMAFDAFMDVTFGLNLDGTAHTEDARFEIDRFYMYNWPAVPVNVTRENFLWQGCGSYVPEEDPSSVTGESAVSVCRTICSTKGIPVAVVRNRVQCACAGVDVLQNIHINSDSCNDDFSWDFYVATALQHDNDDYSITVTVERLGTKEYVKPLEDVMINIETNFDVKVPFNIDFGDGTSLLLDGKQVTYYWQNEGAYDVTVETNVGITTLTASTSFTIKDVDEGYAGDYVMLNVFHGDVSQLANIDFTSIDYASGACNINYGETNITDLELRDLSDYVENSHLTNEYSLFGLYKLNVQCLNPYGTMRNQTMFTARKFETTYHFHEVGTAFTTNMAGNSDFYNDLIVDNSDDNITVSLRHNQTTTLTIDPAFLRIHENYFEYNFEEVTVDKRIINVQNMINKPVILCPEVDGAWNLTTNITVRVPPGNNMYLTVSFSAGEDQLFFIHYLEFQSDIVFEILFPALGYYPVTASITNDISNISSDILVSVEVPLRTIGLKLQNITNKAKPVELFIKLNEGMQGPMKINFEVDFGNGFTDTYSDYSEDYYFKPYKIEYKYPEWGTYDVCVRAYNRISSVTDCVTVQVGQYITYVDIQVHSSGRFEVNETALAFIRCPRGSDRTFVVDFGDGETFIFTDRYLEETYVEPTTTEPPSTTTVFQSTTVGDGTTTSDSGNVTSVSFSSNDAMYGTNGSTAGPALATTTVGTTTAGSDYTTAVPYRRKRREANGTYSAQSENSGYESTTQGTHTTPEGSSGNNSTSASSYGNNSNATTVSTLVGNATGSNANATIAATEATTTVYEETTTEIPETTTMEIITTTEPLPDDATNPYTSNYSTARTIRDRLVALTHRYQQIGTYDVKVKVFNHFNWARDNLCPRLMVVEDTDDTHGSCEPPIITPNPKLESSYKNRMQFYRSQQINLTTTAKGQGCQEAKPVYSWKTMRLYEEDGKSIYRQYHDTGICLLGDSDKIFRYTRATLPFGSYKTVLTVAPDGHPLKARMQEFYFDVNPSPPNAVIDGNDEHKWFLVYGTTVINFAKSIDPDFDRADGIEYDIVCMEENQLFDVKEETRASLLNASDFVIEKITHKYKSKNSVRIYEYSPCFQKDGNFSRDLKFPQGEFNIPSEYFVSDVRSFAFRLFVTKNNYTTHTDVTFEIRLSNASSLLDQLDDLLASKDTTGVMRAVEALSATLVVTPTNASEDEEFEAKEQMKELKDKLIGALDSVSEGVKDIDQAGGMIGLVDDLTKDPDSVSDSARASGSSAIKNSAEVTEGFADEPLDTLTGVGSKVVSGSSNVLPKEDQTLKKLKEHEKALAQAEKDTKAVLGPTEAEKEAAEAAGGDEDGADITLEDETVTELSEEDLVSNAPLPYNKLLKRCGVLHGRQLDKLYKYIFFYESIFRVVIKNRSEEIMITKDILKLPRNEIFCYLSVLEEPQDIEWYVNRFCDVEKAKRDLARKNADRLISNSFLGAIDSMSSVLLNKTESNQTVAFEATGLKVAMKKASSNSTDDSNPLDAGAGVKLPASVLAESGGNDTEVGTTMIVNDQSPFTYANENDTTEVGTSVVTFKLSTPGTKDQVGVSNTTEPIEIYLKGNPEKVQEPVLNTLVVTRGNVQNTMNYHSINVTKNSTTLHIMVRPQFDDSVDEFDVLLQYEDYPNETHYIATTTLPHPAESYDDVNITDEHQDVLRHTFFPDPNVTKLAGIYKVGVRLRSGNIDFQAEKSAFNYTWQMFLGGCRFWNAENETWDSDGCVVGNLTTYNSTQCLCTHLTSFGGEMVVPPNTIDFKNVWAKFKNLNENAAVFSTVISILGLYVIGLIWARHMDKKDIIKWGATPLEDNLPTDNYHYQLSVYTGVKKNAGTKSNVSIIISGEVHDTGVRRLFDGKRKTHDKGSIMNYILSVEESLGPLSFCRVWHDNSGEGKHRSWFLDQIECTDLQTGERYFFLNNRWLACEEDDGMVDRILPSASIEDLVAFKQLFSSSIRKKLTSDHLWLSVFSRPQRSKFTRVQRISCCISLLFLTMITNAMWFKSDGEKEGQQSSNVVSLKLGPFSFTLQQIFISLASTIIVFPPSFLLVTLFRRTKSKNNAVIQSNQRQPKRGKWKNLGNTAATVRRSSSNVWESEPKTTRLKKFKQSVMELVSGRNKTSKYGADDEDEFDAIPQATIAGDPSSRKNQKKKKKPYMFPPWFNYVAWILCFFSIIAPAFFTILYSMEWGSSKANEWLSTFLLSFFQSVIVVQPIKVLCLVAFIACVLKKPDLDEEGDCTAELNNAIAAHDEELTTKGADAIDEIARRRREANEMFEPPDPEALEEARIKRLNEMKMEAILKEICVYGFFVLILFFLSYQQRDMDSFNFTDNLRNLFLGKFEKISTVLDYWVWLEGSFMPALFAAKYHNGSDLYKWWDRRCLKDFEARRIGIARIRQFRIKEDSCTIVPIMAPAINHCRNDYNWFDDDTKAYMPRWQEPGEENRTILEDLDDVDPWVYQNSYRLKSAPYMATLQTYKGGGYVINFERSFRRTMRNLTRLRSEDWLDLRTRAIFIEYTVYNPNANLYASVVLVAEFPAVGAVVTRSEFKVFRLQAYVGGFAIVVIFFQVIYCCFAIFFFVRCIKKVRKERCGYFKSFWDILEFIMLAFAVACIVMYVFKHLLTEVAMSTLEGQSKAEYINFQSLALYDETFGYMTAIVVFLSTCQFLKLLQFNKKMNMLGDTVKLAAKDLKVFSVAFCLYFMAFVVTFYLLFGQYIASYNGIVQSMESAFAFTLGAFDFEAMSNAHKFLGPIFFFLFIAVIYVGLMSIFLTIIADSFTTVKEQTMNAKNEYEMVDFIWRKFKGIIGVK